MNSFAGDQSLLVRLTEEFVRRLRLGEEPAVAEYADQYPELADEIRSIFAGVAMMERWKPFELSPFVSAKTAGGFGRHAIPKQLGDFRIIRFVAEGGMGYVFEAVQESMGRHVALKILKPEIHSPKMLARFLRESQAPGRLHHTNIIPIFGIGECNGLHFYAMQYIHGESLERIIAGLRALRKPDGEPAALEADGDSSREVTLEKISRGMRFGSLSATDPAVDQSVDVGNPELYQTFESQDADMGDASPSAASSRALQIRLGLGEQTGAAFYKSVARIGEQAARALASAHRDGVLHRDIKPSNLLVDLLGTVWVGDFGLAYETDAEDISSGDVVGTLRFIPPERFKLESLPRGDVYSLGLTLYELVTLEPALRGERAQQLMHSIQHEQPVLPREIDANIPRDLETIILKSIEKDPGRRYQTAEEVADDLLAFQQDREIRARRARWNEKFARWCRRNRAVAALAGSVLVLLTTIAVGMSVAVFMLGKEQAATLRQLHLTQNAEDAGRQRLLDSLTARAQAVRRSVTAGRRVESLATIAEAAQLKRRLGGAHANELGLRNEAVASLALIDLSPVGERTSLPLIRDLGNDELANIYLPFDNTLDRCLRRVDDRHFAILDARDGHELARLDSPPGATAAGFSPCGRYVISTARDPDHGSALSVWDLRASKPAPRVFQKRSVVSWAFAPDTRSVAVGLETGAVELIELPSGHALGQIGLGPAAASQEQGMAFAADGRRLAVASDTGQSIRIYDVQERTLLHEWPVGSPVMCAAWSDDGRLLALGGDDHRIYVLDMTRKPSPDAPLVSVLLGHKNTIMRLAFVDHHLISNSHDETVRVWDPVGGSELTWCAGEFFHRGPGRNIVLERPDHGLSYQRMSLLEGIFQSVQQGTFGNRMNRPSGITSSVRFHPSGRWLGTANADGVHLYETGGYREVGLLRQGESRTSCVGFHPSGDELMTYGDEGVRLWPLRAAVDSGLPTLVHGPPRAVASVPYQGACKATYSKDGDALAFAVPFEGWAGFMRMSEPGKIIRLPHPRVRQVVLSGDGRYLATSTWKGTGVKVWDLVRGTLSTEIACNSARCAFSPDSRWLATSFGGACQLWSTENWAAGPEIYHEALNTEGPVAFSPDGTMIAVCTDLGRRIKLIGLDANAELATLEPPDLSTIYDISFSPDGSLLAAATTDLTSQVWNLKAMREKLSEIGLNWDESLDR